MTHLNLSNIHMIIIVGCKAFLCLPILISILWSFFYLLVTEPIFSYNLSFLSIAIYTHPLKKVEPTEMPGSFYYLLSL